MDKEHKIFLAPEDGAEEAVEKVGKGKGDKIILHIPENSVLKSSIDNFYAIKDALGVDSGKIVVESVDSDIEEMAERAGLGALNAIYGREEKQVLDIIPKKPRKPQEKKSKKKEPESSPQDPILKPSAEKEEKTNQFFSAPKKEKKKKKKEKKEKSIKPVNKKKRTLTLMGTFVGLILLGLLAVNFLPKADIEVTLKDSSFSFDEPITASASMHDTVVKKGNILLPGEMLVTNKNIEKKFPASGKKKVEKKASGELYVYNEYSSDPLPLVVNTRFTSPSGKVFRLNEKVTLPGAEVSGGEMIPSKLKVSVTADKAGEEYNIKPDPNKKWPLPAPKENYEKENKQVYMKMYNNLYAKASGDMEGGYSRVISVPTERDIEKAKKEVKSKLRSSLKSQLIIGYSEDFKVLEGSREFEITKMEVSETADENGKFSIFAQGRMRAFVFEEKPLKNTLIKKNTSPLDFDFSIIKSEFNYSKPTVDWDKGLMSFNIQGSLVVEPEVDKNHLKAQLKGQAEEMIKPILFSVPDLKKARVSLWPFWVNSVPKDSERVNIKMK